MSIEIYSKEVEESVLGLILIFKECNKYLKKIDVEDFFLQKNRVVYLLMLELLKQNKPISIISIKELAKAKKENEKEILNYLVEISELAVTSTNIDYYIKKLKNYSVRRKIKQEAIKTIQEIESIDSDIEAADLKKECMKRFSKIKTTDINLNEKEMANVMVITTELLERKVQKKDDEKYNTGFYDLDKITDGLHEQEFTIIAARPRRWENCFCIEFSREHSKKESIYVFCIFRNVRRAITETEC